MSLISVRYRGECIFSRIGASLFAVRNRDAPVGISGYRGCRRGCSREDGFYGCGSSGGKVICERGVGYIR